MAMNGRMYFVFILIAAMLLLVIFANNVVPCASSICFRNFFYELPFCPPGAAMKIKWWSSEEESGNIMFIKQSTFWVFNLFLVLVIVGCGLAAPIPRLRRKKNMTKKRKNMFSVLVTYLTSRISHSVREPREVGWRVPTYRSLLGAIFGIGIQHLILISLAFTFDFPDIFYRLDLGSRTTFLLACSLLCSYFGYYIASCYGEWKRQDGLRDNDVPDIGIRKCILSLLIVIVTDNDFGYNDLIISVAFTVAIGAVNLLSWYVGARIAYSLRYKRLRIRNRETITWWQYRLLSTPAQMFLGGLLPFLAIFTNMDDIYASLLSMKVCGSFSTMLSSFFAVIAMTILLGAGFTSFQLHKKDYIWWWRSVLRGGSTAIFMFAYGIYFYYRVNEETFWNELHIFVVYSGCLCCVFFAVLGTMGFFASSLVFHML